MATVMPQQNRPAGTYVSPTGNSSKAAGNILCELVLQAADLADSTLSIPFWAEGSEDGVNWKFLVGWAPDSVTGVGVDTAWHGGRTGRDGQPAKPILFWDVSYPLPAKVRVQFILPRTINCSVNVTIG